MLRLTMGLFRDVCREVAAEYPDVTCDDWHVDAMAALLVRRGSRLRRARDGEHARRHPLGPGGRAVWLAGDGGLGQRRRRTSRWRRPRTARRPDIAGRGIANPVGMIQSVALLMQWLGERHVDDGLTRTAARMGAAVEAALADESSADAGSRRARDDRADDRADRGGDRVVLKRGGAWSPTCADQGR